MSERRMLRRAIRKALEDGRVGRDLAVGAQALRAAVALEDVQLAKAVLDQSADLRSRVRELLRRRDEEWRLRQTERREHEEIQELFRGRFEIVDASEGDREFLYLRQRPEDDEGDAMDSREASALLDEIDRLLGGEDASEGR